MKMTNFRNQTPNGGSAQVDNWQTPSGGSDVHDSPPPSQTSTDNTSFFFAARSLTRVVNNVHEDKYANVLVMGGYIISTTAAVLATNCKTEMRYENNYNYCQGLQPCYCNWVPYAKRVGCLVTVGVLIVDDWQTLSGGSDVHDSPSSSQTSTDNTSFFSAARSLTPGIVVGIMRATTIIATNFYLVTTTGLHMSNEVIVL
ncbi:hypothetical protein Patl1_26994 [Pistacia atlantica]|uniref:Uncharacterized protein n=1 Tax=Pistacia atlantica TaxID=434234 RepID=A0ACC1B1W6_9ROSI|nr:hypothetical protein Patl1_26994 [Pistacia atlantica]